MTWRVINADCITGMGAELEDNSIDAIVTDPPYGLSRCSEKDVREALNSWLSGNEYTPKGKGFMGKSWDAFVPGPEVWRECLRVLKPGGHMAVFAGSRTVDLMGIAVRLAGFEVRDQMQWLYGSGFPKSMDLSKAIDKSKGAEREVVGTIPDRWTQSGGTYNFSTDRAQDTVKVRGAPSTDLAKQWFGWGTALKPAHEPIILARKPLIGTVAKNVEEHGTGGINVDGCRVGGENGRWPANVILDEEAGALLDEQSGERPGMSGGGKHKTRKQTIAGGGHDGNESHIRADSGGASRFFYCPKASKKEREAGLENFDPQRRTDGRGSDIENPRLRTSERRNTHPTVKPLELMKWLSRLICPPNGIILDPFTGSGSTGCAAKAEGFDFVGFELSGEYCQIARARIDSC